LQPQVSLLFKPQGKFGEVIRVEVLKLKRFGCELPVNQHTSVCVLPSDNTAECDFASKQKSVVSPCGLSLSSFWAVE